MATKTFDELKQLAIQIRDEKTNKQNTATRVGTAMLEGLNKLEQDYYDKTATDKELKERDDKLTELGNKNYSFSDIPNEGNLIDPNKVVSGYYFGDNGKLEVNDEYGYTYIPMRGKNITINYNGGFKLSACDKCGSVTHTNTETAQTVGGRTIQYQEGDEYAMVSVSLDYLGKSASAEYGDEIPNYKDYGYVTNEKFYKEIGGGFIKYSKVLEIGNINTVILSNLQIKKGTIFGISVKSTAEWSRLLLQFYPSDGTEYQRIDNITYKNGEKILAYSVFDIYKLSIYCDTTKQGNIEISLLELGDLTLSDIENQFLINYKSIDIPSEGNLIDPDKIIRGCYFGDNGALLGNDNYGYTYIPMRGKNITINYGGGFKLSACNKYGCTTHTNIESTNLDVTARTIQYQEGDEYAMISVPLDILNKSASAEYGDVPTIYKPYNEHSGNLIKDSSISSKKLDDSVIINKNLFNPDDPDYVEGYYLGLDNTLIEKENYAVSGYIPFTEEMSKLIISSNGSPLNYGGGGVGVFDAYKNKISIEMLNAVNATATWQEGVAFARFSIPDYKKGSIQIEKGDTPTEYIPYSGVLNDKLLPDNKDLNISLSALGNDTETVTKDELNNEEIFSVDTFPLHIKKRIVMSFEALITTFNGIIIGKGYQKYRGDYVKIDATNLTLLHYEQSESQRETVAHGITIEGFIKVAMYTDNSGYLYIIVQSKNGTFTYTFKSWGYEANYEPFVKSINSTLTEIKLNISCQDFRLPVWAFGDSYFGVSANRWPGEIRDFGFFNFLIDGLAGQSSNGAYNDLVKALNFGTPKYLLWCLGMNDSDDTFKTVLDKVILLCQQKGITLIASTIPTVPDRSKEIISQYVRDSGLRYIDFYKAMGATSEGVWYDGYLDTDNVHPTELGAKVLAMQVLIDFPELMQYGLVSTESEIGDITGDK